MFFLNSTPLPSLTNQTPPAVEIPVRIPTSTSAKDTKDDDIVERPPIRRKSTKRKVTFRDSKSHSKTFDPSDVFLIARPNTRATHKPKQSTMDVEKITPQLASVLNQEQTLILHIQAILETSTRVDSERKV